MSETAKGERKPRSMSVLWRLVSLMSPHKGRFVVATLALLFGSGLGALATGGIRDQETA